MSVALLATASPSARAFGACLAGSVLVDMILRRTREYQRRPHSAGFLAAWTLQGLLVLAALVFLFFEPLG